MADNEFVNLEAEEQVLGALMIDPDSLLRVANIITPEMFYLGEHRLIYTTMLSLLTDGEPLDEFTIYQHIKNSIPNAGQKLSELTQLVSTSLYADYHARFIRDAHIKRKIKRAATRTLELLYATEKDAPDEQLTPTEIIGKVTDYFMNTINGTSGSAANSETVINLTLDLLEKKHKHNMGFFTGMKDLDDVLNGIDGGMFILLAGRPSMGKTALALHLMQNISTSDGAKATPLLISLEMTSAHIGQRLLASRAKIDSTKIRTSTLDENEFARVMRAATHLSADKFYINDRTDLTIAELEAQINWEVAYRGVNLVIIDYLQLINGGSKSTDNRNLEISRISRALKNLSVRLNIPIIALSQLSRAVENRADKRPMLSDLRDSGSLEQDADIVMFVYRDDYYNPDSDFPNVVELLVSKNRYGRTGEVDLFFERDTGIFHPLVKHTTTLN